MAAGSVVVKDVPAFALVAGVPAKRIGWVGKAGVKLERVSEGFRCPVSGVLYKEEDGELTEVCE